MYRVMYRGPAPDLMKRVYIVTSSPSRGDVAQMLTNATNAPPAHFVLCYWLLTTYLETGAVG